MNLDKVKIVVVGDSGVGKTSLIHLIIHQEVLKKPNWTIGSSVDVKLHEFKDGTVQHKTYFIEFYDIGGYSAHKSSAKMFYSGVDGIILVHDLTNYKSQENLRQWLIDIIEQNENISMCSSEFFSNDSRQLNTNVGSSTLFKSNSSSSSSNLFSNLNMPPILVIGTKLDYAQKVRNSSTLKNSSPIAMEFRADEINLDCMQLKYLAPATSNSIKLAKFFDKVIEHKITQTNKETNIFNKNKLNKSLTENNKFHSVLHID